MSVGQPDFPTPAAVCEAAKEAIDAGKTKYTPNTGTSSLRKAICNKLRTENDLEYSPDEIVVTNGAKQAIWQTVLACVSPGDEVIVPAPYWVSYPEMVRMAGGVPVVLDTTAESNFCITAEQLQQAVTPRTRLLILCTPSNPSGAVYSGSDLSGIADVVRGHPRMLVAADEIYEHIMYPPHKHVSFAALPQMWERTFTVNGVSKAFAMTGWRIGYVAAPRHFAKATALIQSQSTSGACSVSQVRCPTAPTMHVLGSPARMMCKHRLIVGPFLPRIQQYWPWCYTSTVGNCILRMCFALQAAAQAALELGHSGGEPVADMLGEFLKRRDYVVERLRGLPGLTVVEPQGAFYVLPDFSAFYGPGIVAEGFGDIPDGETLCRYLLEVAHVALVPGEAFGVPQCLRISYAASMETLSAALDRIEKALSSLQMATAAA